MASNTFSYKSYPPTVYFLQEDASLLSFRDMTQNEVLAHHENMVIAVNEGEMRFLPEGEEEWQYAVVGIGFIEIVNNRVVFFSRKCRTPRGNRYRKSTGSKGESFGKNMQKQSIQEYYHITGFPFPCNGETSSW